MDWLDQKKYSCVWSGLVGFRLLLLYQTFLAARHGQTTVLLNNFHLLKYTTFKCSSALQISNMSSFLCFSQLTSHFRLPLPRSYPLPSFIFRLPPHINPVFICRCFPRLLLSGTPRHVIVFPSRGGNGDGSGDARPGQIPGQSRGRNTSIIVTIFVIISQMRRAKLELCPSPSGWLTVTNSSLTHSTHQLYTGQRSPERQEAAKAPLDVSTQLQHKHT